MPEETALPAPFRSGYWYESARPLTSLVFVTPLLLFYEAGVLLLGRQAFRNAADIWLRELLDTLGFSQYFLLPIVTGGTLLAWHHITQQPWRICWSACYGMFLESCLFGLTLVLIASWQSSLLASPPPPAAIGTATLQEKLGQLVGFVGAGIYEEVLFRMLLLSGALALLRMAGFSRRDSLIAAVVATSLLFAAAHYRFAFSVGAQHFATQHGEAFGWSSFLFRTLAGGCFSLLFIFRGFGVTAGTHAMYDVFTLVF
jgi:membrane protease YdiL (CAAX protease family)